MVVLLEYYVVLLQLLFVLFLLLSIVLSNALGPALCTVLNVCLHQSARLLLPVSTQLVVLVDKLLQPSVLNYQVISSVVSCGLPLHLHKHFLDHVRPIIALPLYLIYNCKDKNDYSE